MNSNHKKIEYKYSRSFQFMTVDLIENILQYSDNPDQMGDSLLLQLKELIGGRIIALIQYLEITPKIINRIISVCPKRYKPKVLSSEFEELIVFCQQIRNATILDQENTPLKINQWFKNENFNNSLVIPLNVGLSKVGVLIILDLYESERLTEILNPLEMLSTIIALILRGALLHEKQEDTIKERTYELEISKNRYALAQEAAKIGSWELDLVTNKLYWSEQVGPMFGYFNNEFDNTIEYFYKCVFHEDVEMVRTTFDEYIKTCKDVNFEHRIRLPNGTIKWVLEKGKVIPDENGIPFKMIGIIQDITEKKNFELSLEENEEKYRKIFEEAIDAIIITDIETGILLNCNQATSNLLGMEKEEIIGKHYSILFPDDELVEGVGKSFSLLLKKKDDQIYESKLLTKNKEVKIVSIKSSIFELNGKKIVQGIFRDITELKKLEEENLKLQNLESLGLLAGGIAHDFNNILSTIMGRISLALEGIVDNDIKENLLAVEKASKRAVGLTHQLLTFAKGGVPEKSNIFLSKIIEDTTKFSLSGSNIEVDFDFKERSMILADPRQISQVIQNIIINAKQSMPTGGTIKISTENRDEANGDKFVKIIITDTGNGIPKEFLNKIFDPYFTTKKGGYGLGLSVCHSIITKHDGKIFVESNVEKGTTFTIILPAITEVLTPKIELKSSLKNKLNILVMDDEPEIRDVISFLLIKQGHKVDAVSEGLAAINIYKEAMKNNNRYDLVFMDLTVKGGMGGKEAVRKLKEYDPNAKVIVSSGYADSAIANYKKDGFDGLLNKPYTKNDLIRVINEIMNY